MKKEKIAVGDYVIELCTEENLLDIEKFVHENLSNQEIMTLVPPTHKLSNYEDEVALRYKLFSNIEDFFFIHTKDSQQISGLISFSMLGEVETTVCATGIIMCPAKIFEKTMQTICSMYKDICIKTVNKVKVVETATEIQPVVPNFINAGFSLEATLKAEAHDGDDICQYSFFFD